MKRQVDLENITILDLLYILTKKYNGKPALQTKTKDGMQILTYDELRERSVGVSSFLIEKGIEPQTHIAILTENRPEWAIAFFGIISAACVTVPVDAKLSIKETLFILNDSQAKCLFVSKKFLDEILSHKEELPNLKYIICLDQCLKEGVLQLDDLRWKEGLERNRPEGVKPENTVLIVYTSGTTGVAKGVMLSYKNLLFEVMSLYNLIRFTPQDSFVSILPLNHMLEITGGLVAPLYGGSTVTYCPTLKPTHIISLMQEVKATGMICVPLVLKMFYNGIVKEIEKLPSFKQKIFKQLFKISRFLLKFNIRLGKFLFKDIHSKFGKEFKYFVCGGAPLDIQLEQDAYVLGFAILQGYGLTETAPVACVNTPANHRYGSVGKPLAGIEIKLLQSCEDKKEGEIIIKGPNVMKGYYNNPEKTAEALKDGWYYTGDLGYFDDDGFLYICGRAKNLIVLGAGKKVFPEEVEQVMSESPFIKEICVLGRKATQGLKKGTEEVFAVVVPNLDRFSQDDKGNKEKIKEKISQEISRLSNDLAEYKKISDFTFYYDELPKTSTKKIKRKEVANLIEESQEPEEVKGEFLATMAIQNNSVFESLKELISQETGVNKEKIQESSYLASDLGVDSLQKVELLCAIESKLGIAIPEEMAYEISTFQDLVRFVNEYKEGRKDIEIDWDKEINSLLRKKFIFWPTRFLTILILKALSKTYFRLKVEGINNIPKEKAFIIAANHSSHLDFPLLFSILPLSRSMNVIAPAAADYFYKNKFRRILLESALNTFAFQRYGNFIQSLKICKALLKKGVSLILFPEGTRSLSGDVGEFKPGIGALSCELGAGIVPIYIEGAHKALAKGSLFLKPSKIIIRIGNAIYPSGQGGYDEYKKLADKTREAVIGLKENKKR